MIFGCLWLLKCHTEVLSDRSHREVWFEGLFRSEMNRQPGVTVPLSFTVGLGSQRYAIQNPFQYFRGPRSDSRQKSLPKAKKELSNFLNA